MNAGATSGFAQARDLVRDADRDRYIATLLAPADKREALIALHAFDIELARIPRLARQQIAGEIRLQWWREAVDGSDDHEARSNPVAAALMATVAGYDLSRDALQAMIDAHGAELMPEPFADTEALLAWCDGVWGSQIRCACRILDAGNAVAAAAQLVDAGRAIGITQLLMSFAARAARGQNIVPDALLAAHRASAADVTAGPAAGRVHGGVAAALADLRALAQMHIAVAQTRISALPSSLRPALVLLSLVELRLAWLAQHAQEPYVAGDVPRWRKLWRMWRCA
jgi:phytoene synthase